jgi:hypothetical protein
MKSHRLSLSRLALIMALAAVPASAAANAVWDTLVWDRDAWAADEPNNDPDDPEGDGLDTAAALDPVLQLLLGD